MYLCIHSFRGDSGCNLARNAPIDSGIMDVASKQSLLSSLCKCICPFPNACRDRQGPRACQPHTEVVYLEWTPHIHHRPNLHARRSLHQLTGITRQCLPLYSMVELRSTHMTDLYPWYLRIIHSKNPSGHRNLCPRYGRIYDSS